MTIRNAHRICGFRPTWTLVATHATVPTVLQQVREAGAAAVEVHLVAQAGELGAAGGEGALACGLLVLLHRAPQLHELPLGVRRAGLTACSRPWQGYSGCSGQQVCLIHPAEPSTLAKC